MNAGNAFIKSRNVRAKNKLPKGQIQKHAHPVHTANELITKQTCAGMAQTLLKNLKRTKLTIIMIQETRVINQEHLHRTPQHLSSKILYTEKTTTSVVTFKICNSICNILPTK